MKRLALILAALLAWTAQPLWASDQDDRDRGPADDLPSPVTPPAPTIFVLDTAAIFPPSFEDEVNARLLELQDRTGIQFIVMTVDERLKLEPNQIASLLFRSLDENSVEQRSKAIIVLSPTKRKFVFNLELDKKSTNLPQGFTAKGYLETIGLRVDDAAKPHLQKQDYMEGIRAAVGAFENALEDPASWTSSPTLDRKEKE